MTYPEALSGDQFARLLSYAVVQQVRAGDVVFRPGDPAYDLVLIESGRIVIVAPAADGEPEAVVAAYGPGGFLGELNLLTGQSTDLTARVTQAGRIHRISPAALRRLLSDDPAVADVLLGAFLARRARRPGRHVEIVGYPASADTIALRMFVARRGVPHVWLDADSVAGRVLMRATPLAALDLPAVITPDRVLRRVDAVQLAEALGLPIRRSPAQPADLTVIGSGPAGLAAAVYGASEGLRTLVLEAGRVGGQATTIARLGDRFSGREFISQAAGQAERLGVRLAGSREATGLDATGQYLRIELADGAAIDTRAVVVATGLRYRTPGIPRWADFHGIGIHYAASECEARAYRGMPVTVVGASDAAGRAALFLAGHDSPVILATSARLSDTGMSAYLRDRIGAHPRITVMAATEVTGLFGGASLEEVGLTGSQGGGTSRRACRGLFCFLGADPRTSWRHGLSVDRGGFIRTGAPRDESAASPVWAALGREPLPFETSVPAVFAAGDVRHGSGKSVAVAVGEGTIAARSAQTAIGFAV